MSNLNVSIIIPTYNAEKYIAETIQSVINQTVDNWEAVIVDDCSTDNTNLIAQQFCSKDSRIKIYKHDVNRGVSNARNTGINQAKFDWLVFLDADDLLYPEYIEKMFSEVKRNPGINCVHCGWYRLGFKGEIDYYNRCYAEGRIFPEFTKKNALSTVSVCMVTKKITESVHGFDSNYIRCADWDFWQKIARVGTYFKSIENPLVYYRIAENSLSSDIILVTEIGLEIIDRGHSFDIRVPFADPEFIYGMPKKQLQSAKLNWILWPCAYLIGKRQDPGSVFKFVRGCDDSNMDAKYVAGVLHDTIMAAEGRNSESWNEYWSDFENEIYSFLVKLEDQSGTCNLAEDTFSRMKEMILSS